MDRKRIILYAAAAVLAVALLIALFLPKDDGIINVGICIADRESERDYAQQLEAALTKMGYTPQLVDAKNDQSLQNSQIDTFINEKYDALVVSMVMTSTAEELVQKVQEAGVPTILIGREPDGAAIAGGDLVCFVGCDAGEPGRIQGQLVAQLPNGADVNDDGTVSYLLLQDAENKIATQLRSDGAAKGMLDAGVTAQELARVAADGTQTEARRQTAMHLAQMGKDIELILCNNDKMALGALEAITDGGRSVGKDIYIIGIDGIPEAIQKIRDGVLTATVTEDRSAQADKVGAVLAMLLQGNATEKRYYIPHIAVTADNAGQFSE